MKKGKIFLMIIGLVLSMVLIGFVASYAQEAEEFFKGETLEFYCPYSVGGGFDIYSRTIAKYLPKYLPIKIAIVKNVTGGGGLTGSNQLYKAPADGLTIGIINGGGMVFNQVLDTPGVYFDLTKFSWLGRVAAEPHLMVVGSQTPYYNIYDIPKANKELVMAQTGKGSDDYLAAGIIAVALGYPLRQIVGYEGATEANLAVVRGDADGTQATAAKLLPLVKSGDVRPMIVINLERMAELPEVPLALEVAPEEYKEYMVAITNVFAVEKIIAGPPGIPEDRLKILREAFWKVVQDELFINELEKAGRIVVPLEGEKLAGMVKESMSIANTVLKPILVELMK